MTGLTRRQAGRRSRGRDEGFTLIELLIVIAILGILSVVVVIGVGGLTDRGQTSACEVDERAVRTAAEAYLAQNGSYPTSEAAMVPQFLNQESALHDYAPPATSGGPIQITGVGECA